MTKQKEPSRFHHQNTLTKYALSGDSESFGEAIRADQKALEALLEIFGLSDDPQKYYKLALRLARMLYPEPKKRGRKSTWSPLRRLQVVTLIEEKIDPSDPAKGISWACRQLANKEPFLSESAEVLRKVYHNTKKDLQVVSSARRPTPQRARKGTH